MNGSNLLLRREILFNLETGAQRYFQLDSSSSLNEKSRGIQEKQGNYPTYLLFNLTSGGKEGTCLRGVQLAKL